MNTAKAIKVVDSFRKNLKPGCEMDVAILTLINEVKRGQYEERTRDHDRDRNPRRQ